MATLKEQISNKCKHFTGIQNKHCALGILYSEVRFDKPYKFPCLNEGGQCKACVFPSAAEVEKEEQELQKSAIMGLSAYAKISAISEQRGKTECECGGTLFYAKSEINGHISAKCDTCDLTLQE